MASIYPGTLAGAPSLARIARVVSTDAGGRLQYLENMRGAATLLVITTHCLGLAWSASDAAWSLSDPVLSAIAGATPIFVFISGFIFHRLGGGAFQFPAFVRSKASTLLPPYLIVTAVLLCTERALGYDVLRYPGLRDPLAQYAMAVAAGGGGPAMWYIPFAVDLALLSPLFLAFMRASPRGQRGALALLLALGLLVDRSAFDRFANLAHFGFYHALGIYCAMHRARFEALVRSTRTILVAAATIVLLAFAQYWLASCEAAGWQLPWPSGKLIYLHKIALIVLLAGIALRVADRPVPGLSLAGRWSFGLFFAHQLSILLVMPLAAHLGLAPGYAALFFYSALVIAIAGAMLWSVRRIFGPQSRLLIGA